MIEEKQQLFKNVLEIVFPQYDVGVGIESKPGEAWLSFLITRKISGGIVQTGFRLPLQDVLDREDYEIARAINFVEHFMARGGNR